MWIYPRVLGDNLVTKQIFHEISLYDVIVCGVLIFCLQIFFVKMDAPWWGNELATITCLVGVVLGLRARIKDRTK